LKSRKGRKKGGGGKFRGYSRISYALRDQEEGGKERGGREKEDGAVRVLDELFGPEERGERREKSIQLWASWQEKKKGGENHITLIGAGWRADVERKMRLLLDLTDGGEKRRKKKELRKTIKLPFLAFLSEEGERERQGGVPRSSPF